MPKYGLIALRVLADFSRSDIGWTKFDGVRKVGVGKWKKSGGFSVPISS